MSQANILLADDNKLVVKVTSTILEGAGYNVIVAWDGLEAINKAYAEEPDLVILDIEMPKVNGYQVCRLLKDDEFTRSIPIVMLTGRDQQSDMFWGMKTGADAYITKGFKPEQLLTVVEDQIERSRSARGNQKQREVPAKLLDESAVMSRVIGLLDSRLFESTILNELGVLASVSQDYRETVKSVLEILARVVGNSAGVVLMFEEEAMIVQLNRPTRMEGLVRIKDDVLGLARGQGWDLANLDRIKVSVYGEEHLFESTEQVPEREYAHIHIPLKARDRVVGLLVLSNYASHPLGRPVQGLLKVIQNQVTIVIDNARLYEGARLLAITDGLTRIYNHRFFQELFEKEYNRAYRYDTVFSMIMLDIDLFKEVNDTCGHLFGDEILVGLANLVKSCLRSMDTVARYGGEEFAVLLPETNGIEATYTAERIRKTVEGYIFHVSDRELNITVSQGVTTFPSPGIQGRFDIIAKADAALYEAKEAGRNRVVFKE